MLPNLMNISKIFLGCCIGFNKILQNRARLDRTKRAFFKKLKLKSILPAI